jgi:hypothetical protein
MYYVVLVRSATFHNVDVDYSSSLTTKIERSGLNDALGSFIIKVFSVNEILLQQRNSMYQILFELNSIRISKFIHFFSIFFNMYIFFEHTMCPADNATAGPA